MNPVGWARCTDRMVDVLRRGAWYPILEDNGDKDVVVEVDHKPLPVARDHVVIIREAPSRWSVVVRTGVMRPTWSGAGASNPSTYAVCPHCRERQFFEGKPATLPCIRCKQSSPVDWSTTC